MRKNKNKEDDKMTKRTYLPSELPEDEKDLLNVMLNGCKIKNPYAEDAFNLSRIVYGIKILNELIDKKVPILPNKLSKFKLPKIFKELVKEMDRKARGWKFP